MTHLRHLALTIALFTAVSVSPAAAVIIAVEPDDFAADTDISNAFSGIALSTVGGNGTAAVYSATDGRASTGTRTFANDATGGQVDNLVWDHEGGPLLRIDFALPTGFVSIDAINQDSFDGGRLLAFNTAGDQIALVEALLIGGIPATLSAEFASPIISYVIVGGYNAQDPAHLDNLRYDRAIIPEPAAAGLTAFLLGLGFVAQRRRSRA